MEINYNYINNNTIGIHWLKQGWEVFKNMPGSNLPVFSGKEHSISYRERGSLGSILSALVSYIWAIALSLSVPLVCLRKLPAIDALKLSIKAVIANIKPLVIYFLMVIVLIIIAIIPIGLGLFVAMPVIFCANYALYDSLFNTKIQDKTSLDKSLEDYKKS